MRKGLRSAATRRDDHPDERVRVAFGRPSPVSLQRTAAAPQDAPRVILFRQSLNARPRGLRSPQAPRAPRAPRAHPRRKEGPLACEGALLSVPERRSARALRHPHVGARARRRLRRRSARCR